MFDWEIYLKILVAYILVAYIVGPQVEQLLHRY